MSHQTQQFRRQYLARRQRYDAMVYLFVGMLFAIVAAMLLVMLTEAGLSVSRAESLARLVGGFGVVALLYPWAMPAVAFVVGVLVG